MQKCEECGLPIKVCSALATYRSAVDNYKLGRANVAQDYAETAKRFHDAYIEEYRLAAPSNVG